MNYDGSQVGVPYVRAHRVTIDWPDATGVPAATIEQSLGVRLVDGSVRRIEDMSKIEFNLDFSHATDPIPLVNPDDGSHLGQDTNLQMAMLNVLAVIRKQQILVQG